MEIKGLSYAQPWSDGGGGARRREQREATVFGREKLECLRYILGFWFISINLY